MKIKHVMLFCFLMYAGLSCTSDSDLDQSNTVSGSYSTMLQIRQFLYVVSKIEITTFDVSDPKAPKRIDTEEVGFDIESLYHHDGLLLIGSANNMYIYSIGDDGIPTRKSSTTYNQLFDDEVCTSDPIVTRGDIAYVTLSSSIDVCGNRIVTNELRTYNIADIAQPVLIDRINMSAPKGLGLGTNNLYICDAIDGLVVMDISDPTYPIVTKKFGGFTGYDVIVKGNILIVVAENELRQYDISDEQNISLLSTIAL